MTKSKEKKLEWFKRKYHSDPLYKKRLNLSKTEMKRRNKIKAVEYKGGVCQRCKGTFDPCIYDFHHVDPAQKDAIIAMLLSRPWSVIAEELDKCILLCSNCHRLIHKEINLKKENNMNDVNISETVAEDAANAGAALNKLAADIKRAEGSEVPTPEVPATNG